MTIFLCHKCAGLLTGKVPFPSYGCGCMSGWVRDHQYPTPEADVNAIQVKRQHDWLVLYDHQGRSESDPTRLATIRLLERITQSPYPSR